MEKDITCKYWSKREKQFCLPVRHSRLEGKKSSNVIKITVSSHQEFKLEYT